MKRQWVSILLAQALIAFALAITSVIAAPAMPASAQTSGSGNCSGLNRVGTNCRLTTGSGGSASRPSPGSSNVSYHGNAAPPPRFIWLNTLVPCDASQPDGWTPVPDLIAASADLAAAGVTTPATPGQIWMGELFDPASGPTNTGFAGCVQVGGALPPQPTLPQAGDIWAAALTFVPDVNLDPLVRGLTGLETHLWYSGPTSDTVALTLNGFSTQASIVAETFAWDMDGPDRNGRQLRSSGVAGSRERPAASHTYALPGTMDIHHQIQWSGRAVLTGPGLPSGGVGMDLGTATLSVARDYDVIEVRAPVVR